MTRSDLGWEALRSDWVSVLAKFVRQRKGWAAWALAGGILAGSIAIRIALAQYVQSTPLLLFFPALCVTVLLCDWRPAAVTLAISALAAWRFFLPHAGLPDALNPIMTGRLIGFVTVGGLEIGVMSVLVSLIRRLDQAQRVQITLFNELQHRVANNMQIIAGMLEQTRRTITDPNAAELVNAAAARIGAMGQLHRRLYDSAAYAGGLEPILRETLAEAFRDLAVDLRLDIAPEPLSVDQMTAITLLANEAAMNAAKHVFRIARGQRFEVRLTTAAPGRLRLAIHDDGPGLGEGAVSHVETQRFGMGILRALASQLGGALEHGEGPGTTLLVEFAPA